MSQICTEFSKEYPLFEMANPQPNFGMGGYPTGYPTNPNTGINMGNMINPNMNQQMGNEREICLGKIKKKCKEKSVSDFYNWCFFGLDFDESLEIAKKMEGDLNYQRTNLVDLQNTWLKLADEETKLTKLEVII